MICSLPVNWIPTSLRVQMFCGDILPHSALPPSDCSPLHHWLLCCQPLLIIRSGLLWPPFVLSLSLPYLHKCRYLFMMRALSPIFSQPICLGGKDFFM